jgi:hypothetical protein
MFHKHSHSERVLFINTPASAGCSPLGGDANRFNGFFALSQTAEAVRTPPPHSR